MSVVYGSMPPEAYRAATGTSKQLGKENGAQDRVPFFACGISSVMHPHNPFAPTMHFNYRSAPALHRLTTTHPTQTPNPNFKSGPHTGISGCVMSTACTTTKPVLACSCCAPFTPSLGPLWSHRLSIWKEY